MTLRDALMVLWRRKLIVLLTVILGVATGFGYWMIQVPEYRSSTTFCLTSPSGIGSATLAANVDPVALTSPEVLERTATILGEPERDLAANIEYSVLASVGAPIITVTVLDRTSSGATALADALLTGFGAHLDDQFTQTRIDLTARADEARNSAVKYQNEVAADPANRIASANLANALSALGRANGQIVALDGFGKPIQVVRAPDRGQLVTPGLLTSLALAFVCGLIAGCGLALLRDQFDKRLREDDDLDALTGVPSLGALNYDRRATRYRGREIAVMEDRTPLSEGISALRTTIQVLLPKKSPVVVITSVAPGDGKTFVSANLSAAFARSGRQVILVGGDLRRPALGKHFGPAADERGLAELLIRAGQPGRKFDVTAVDAYLIDTNVEGLRILPAGSVPSDPADALATDSFQAVIRHLASQCDLVLIDSPPALVMADASLLAGVADGVVVLAAVNTTHRDHLVETVATLRGRGASVLGIVPNKSRRRMPKRYGAYYYYYGSTGAKRDDQSNGRYRSSGVSVSKKPGYRHARRTGANG